MEIYTKKELLKALREAREKYPELNIGVSTTAYLRYEYKGIIKKANEGMNYRFYTREDIEEAVRSVVEYKQDIYNKKHESNN